jgi:hypothetical protein
MVLFLVLAGVGLGLLSGQGLAGPVNAAAAAAPAEANAVPTPAAQEATSSSGLPPGAGCGLAILPFGAARSIYCPPGVPTYNLQTVPGSPFYTGNAQAQPAQPSQGNRQSSQRQRPTQQRQQPSQVTAAPVYITRTLTLIPDQPISRGPNADGVVVTRMEVVTMREEAFRA